MENSTSWKIQGRENKTKTKQTLVLVRTNWNTVTPEFQVLRAVVPYIVVSFRCCCLYKVFRSCSCPTLEAVVYHSPVFVSSRTRTCICGTYIPGKILNENWLCVRGFWWELSIKESLILYSSLLLTLLAESQTKSQTLKHYGIIIWNLNIGTDCY